MTAIAQHLQPTTKQDCIDTWRERRRIPVPSRNGMLLDLHIVHLFETATVDSIPLDLLIEARATKLSPTKRFGVIFSESQPVDDYPIPILWRNEATGIWLT